MATAKATTDHDEIRNWVESRGGHPARVKSTGTRNDPGVLRIDFPGFSGEDTLEAIEWDEFFEWFDRNELALLLSDEEGNRFNKLVSRETAAPSRSAAAAARKSSSRRAGAKPSRRRVSRSSSGKKPSSTKKASSAKKASSSTKKAASSKKAASTKKASSSKKASTKKASASKKTSSKKAPSKKAPSKKASSKKASSSTRRLVGSTTSRKASTKKASSRKAAGKITTDHDEIRRWVEARGGYPAHVRQTGRKRGDLGVLRIDYPGYSGKDTLERVDWEDWFAAFDRNKLAFLHDNKRNSRFSKLVNR